MSMSIDRHGRSRLGKRSYSVYASDDAPPRRPAPAPASSLGDPHTRAPYVSIQPPVEPKAMQVYRRCTPYVSTLASHTSLMVSRLWAWFWDQVPGAELVHVCAVATTPEDNKRRAVVWDAQDGRSTVSDARTRAAAPAPEPKAIHPIPGAFPEPALTPPEPARTPPEPARTPPEPARTPPKPGLTPLKPATVLTPPESRASSSQDHKHGEVAATEQPTPKQLLPLPRVHPTPNARARADNDKDRIPRHTGMSLKAFMQWNAKEEAKRTAAKAPTPSVAPVSYGPRLPRTARDAIAREKARSERKLQEEEHRKDADVDALLARAKAVAIDPPAVRELKQTFRRRQHLRQLEAARKARAEEEAIKQAELEAARKLAEQEAKEKPEPLVQPLNATWAEKVKDVMASKDQRKAQARVGEFWLSRRDFGSLLPASGHDHASAWLNDEIVNAFLTAIVERKKEQTGYQKDNKDPHAPKVPAFASFNTAWYNTYKSKGVAGLARWSRRMGIKGENLLAAEKIFFPINTGAHWTLVIVSPRERVIEYLDSMHGSPTRGMGIAREWLAMELGKAYHADEWTESRACSSMQTNSDDCGVFTCFNALVAAKGRAFDEVCAESMQDARRLLGAILINGGFRGDFEL